MPKQKPDPKSGPVTQTALAQLLGVSRQYIGKLIKQGKLHYVEGTKKLDPAECAKALEALRDPARKSKADQAIGVGATTWAGTDGEVIPSFAEAKAAKEYWQAKLARLKYEEESGQVISKDQVSSKAFDAGRIARDNLLSIPARLMDVLAVETDPRQIHSLLEEDIKKVLDELIRSLKQ